MRKGLATIIITVLISLAVMPVAFAAARFVGNKRNKKLHDTKHSICRSYIKKMAKKNKRYFKTKKAAYKAGYRSCKKC